MGASNAVQAYTHWAQLGHRDHRLLCHMALVTLDAGQPPVYFGGWQDAARALGLDPEQNPASARRNVMKVIGALSDAGAVVPSGVAHSGRRAEYALTLDPARTAVPTGTATGPNGRAVTTWRIVDRATGRPVDKSPRLWERVTETVPQRVTETVTHKGDRNGPERVTETVTPRKNEEPHEEYREENIPSGGENSTGASTRRPLYARALAHLEAQPDRGATALAGVPAHLGQRERVIAAARATGFDPEHAKEDAA